jgi:hypothetical protein
LQGGHYLIAGARRGLNRVQEKELIELRAQVEQDKTIMSCMRQELDDVNKVFLAPAGALAARPCSAAMTVV